MEAGSAGSRSRRRQRKEEPFWNSGKMKTGFEQCRFNGLDLFHDGISTSPFSFFLLFSLSVVEFFVFELWFLLCFSHLIQGGERIELGWFFWYALSFFLFLGFFLMFELVLLTLDLWSCCVFCGVSFLDPNLGFVAFGSVSIFICSWSVCEIVGVFWAFEFRIRVSGLWFL